MPLALVLVLIAGGLAFYLRSQAAPTTGGGGPIINVPVVTVVVGDLRNRTVRATGHHRRAEFPIVRSRRASRVAARTPIAEAWAAMAWRCWSLSVAARVAPAPTSPWSCSISTKAGIHVKKEDVVAQFDPTNQLQRLDDYKDTVIQTDNQIKKMIASLAATKEAHDQTVRAAKAAWDQAILDLGELAKFR